MTPVVRVREIDRVLGFISHVLHDEQHCRRLSATINPLPTIAWDGQVTLISPELAGFTSGRHGPFACGSVVRDPLDALIAEGMSASWVREYRIGIQNCQISCRYFEFCGGGQPANRHFEHDHFDTTETAYCANSKIALMEGVLRIVRFDANPD